jgi:uncharacterized protein
LNSLEHAKGDNRLELPSIKPYHLFNHGECSYLINVEDMTAAVVNKETASTLQINHAQSAAMLGQDAKEDLRKLGLLSEGAQKTCKSQREYFISNLCLFLTQSCNLNCFYCYGDGGSYGTGGNMDQKTAYRAVDWLVEQSGKMKQIHIGFFGGEPFLMFHLMKAIVQYATKRATEVGKTISFQATSNATLFDDEVIAFIKDVKMSVLVSFDGPREIQDYQRPYANGDGSYYTTVPKIKKLLAVCPETPGHAVLVGNTDPKVVKVALQDLGFTNISLIPASQSLFTANPDHSKQSRDIQKLIQLQEKQVNMWLYSIKKRDVEALKGHVSKSELYPALISLLHNSKRRHACGAGLGMVAVSSAGDVYLCHRFVGQDDYRLGSIFEDQLDRKECQESPTTDNPLCSVCFAKYYCAGGCKHDNAGSCGSIATPAQEICRLRCRELELAAVIISNLTLEDKAFLIEQGVFKPKPCPLDF